MNKIKNYQKKWYLKNQKRLQEKSRLYQKNRRAKIKKLLEENDLKL